MDTRKRRHDLRKRDGFLILATIVTLVGALLAQSSPDSLQRTLRGAESVQAGSTRTVRLILEETGAVDWFGWIRTRLQEPRPMARPERAENRGSLS